MLRVKKRTTLSVQRQGGAYVQVTRAPVEERTQYTTVPDVAVLNFKDRVGGQVVNGQYESEKRHFVRRLQEQVTFRNGSQHELMFVVTHLGAHAGGGHYVSYARQAPGSDRWWRVNNAPGFNSTVDVVSTRTVLANAEGGMPAGNDTSGVSALCA